MEIITWFSTTQDVEKVLEVFEKKGYKWASWEDIFKAEERLNWFEKYQKRWGFFIKIMDDIKIWSIKHSIKNRLAFWSINYLVELWLEGVVKINFQDFLERENKEVFTKWELVEVSECGSFWERRIFIEKFNNGYSCVLSGIEDNYNNWNYYNTHLWDFIRKIPKKTSRTFEFTDDEFEKVNNFISSLK